MKNAILWLLVSVCMCHTAHAGGRLFARIAEPLNDVIIPTDQAIHLRAQFFTGFQVRGKEEWIAASAVEAVWTISDGRTFFGLEPGPVFFDTAGTYTVEFQVRLEGRSAYDSRSVTVTNMGPGFSDATGDVDDPTRIVPGVYADFRLDSGSPARFLVFSASRPDYVYRFWASSSAAGIGMQLLDVAGNPIHPLNAHVMRESHSLRARGLEAGDYLLALFLDASQSSQVFDLHVDVKTPNRVISGIESNDDIETGISVAYYGSEKACPVDYAAYDASGIEVDRQCHLLLPGHARHFVVGDVFQRADEIAWIQINTGFHIVAHSHVFHRRQFWSHGTLGQLLPYGHLVVSQLTSEGRSLVPSFGLVNTSGTDSLVELQTPERGYNVNGFLQARSVVVDSFADLYQGDEPQADVWGVFRSNAVSPDLIGIQRFDLAGTDSGSAAIELVNPQADQIHGSRYLFIPFVSVNPETGSWTDFVIANLEDIYSSFHATLYNEWGQILGERTQTIDRLEKQRYAVSEFAAAFVDHPSQVAWIEIQAVTDMAACALIGTQNATSSHVAGLPAGTYGVSQLWHLLVPSSQADWTKAALINLSDEHNDVTILGLDEFGKTVVKHDFVINPKKRLWGTAEEIFNALFAYPEQWQRIRVIRIDASQPLFGFQVCGDQQGNHLAAFMADY